MIADEVDRVITATSGPQFAMQGGPTPDSKVATARVCSYEAACSTLLAMAPIGGFWAEDEHCHIWQRALERLSVSISGAGYTLWLELHRYPGTLLLYGLGLGAIEADRLKFLGRLFLTSIHRENPDDFPAVQLLPPFCLFADGGQRARILSGMDRRHAPLNDWLHDVLRKPAGRLIPNDNRYTLVFDKLEIMIALGFARHAKRTKDWYWAPPGAFGYRSDNRSRVLQEVEQSISSKGDQSPYVTSGIFGDSAESCTQALTAFREFIAKISGNWY